MKKVLLSILIMSLPFFVAAQRDVTTNQMLLSRGLGIANDIIARNDVVGSEFLNDNWTNAIIQTQKNEIYKDVNVKYNVLDDQLYFLGEKDITMKFIVPIKEFSLIPNNEAPKIFRSGFPKINNYNEASFYQVLTAGKVILLKKTNKRIIDKREYNSAITIKEYIENTKYFLCQNGKMSELKRDKTFMLTYLGKKEAMEDFIASKKTDLKKEEDLIKIVSFYNSL